MKHLSIPVFTVFLSCNILYAVREVSVSCMMAYEEGGAPAVFSSPDCPHWVSSSKSIENYAQKCNFATLQGHREYQEDRVTCNLDLKLPFSGEGGAEEIAVGIAAIFDGHGGHEASEMASIKLVDYFFLHAVFTAYDRVLSNSKEHHTTHFVESSPRLPMFDHHSLCMILENALLRTIKDIDSEFSKKALEKRYISGSTASVILFVGQFLVANVGDSKALLCSRKNLSIYAEELTRDHRPDREDEKARIEAASGFVTKSSIPRVNGVLAVSRAIGDLYLKRYGVIAEPELTGWRPFTSHNNNVLILASDGVFETLTPEHVCQIVYNEASSKRVDPSSLPDRIIRRAFTTGSTDNLSAIVISHIT